MVLIWDPKEIIVLRSLGVVMARSRTGEAVSAHGRTPSAMRTLREFIQDRAKSNNLDEWRRGRQSLGISKVVGSSTSLRSSV